MQNSSLNGATSIRQTVRTLWPAMVRLPIAWKLALIMTLPVVLGMALLGLLIASNQTSLLSTQLDEFGRALTQQLAQSAAEPLLADDDLTLRTLINNLERNPQILGAAIYAESDSVAASAGAVPAYALAALELELDARGAYRDSFSWLWQDRPGRELEVVSFIEPIEFQEVVAGHVLITYSQRAMNRSLVITKQSVIGATLVMVFVSVALALALSRRLTRPVGSLVEASQAIARGEYNHRIQHQRRDELGVLIDSFNRMARGLEEKLQVESALSRYVSPGVANQILDNLGRVELGGHKTRGTVMFADMVGFTNISEKLPPEQVGELLNDYFSFITTACRYYRGTIDKFIGDCAMAVFGVLDKDQDHTYHAIAAAVMIQAMVRRLNERRTANGKLPVHFRIGIQSGEMLAGNMGSQERMQFTVVGDTVNLASRLAAEAEAGDILITEDLYSDPGVLPRVRARRRGTLQLRGIHKPVHTCVVDDLEESERKLLQGYVDRLLVEHEIL